MEFTQKHCYLHVSYWNRICDENYFFWVLMLLIGLCMQIDAVVVFIINKWLSYVNFVFGDLYANSF